MVSMVIKMFTSVCRGTTLNSLRQNLVPDWRTTNDYFLLWLTMYYYVLFVCCTLVSEDYFYKAVMEVQFMLCIATLGLNT